MKKKFEILIFQKKSLNWKSRTTKVMLKKCQICSNRAKNDGIMAKKQLKCHWKFTMHFACDFDSFLAVSPSNLIRCWSNWHIFNINFLALDIWFYDFVLKNKNLKFFFFKKLQISHGRDFDFCMEYLLWVSWFQKFIICASTFFFNQASFCDSLWRQKREL